MEILIRPSYIYMQKSYNARLDSACARMVKSARFEARSGLDRLSVSLFMIHCVND